MLRTIRSKMMAAFAISLFSICVLSALHLWELTSLRGKFLLSASIDELLNDTLEVRRFEKNFLFYNDPGSLTEGLTFLAQIDQLVEELTPDIIRLVGRERFAGFVSDLRAYEKTISDFQRRSPPDAQDRENIRLRGKALVDFATELQQVKHGRIQKAIERSSMLPFAFLGVFILLAVLLAALLSRRVLAPLEVVRETTQRVAQGDFRPIAYNDALGDEIAALIGAFNVMARELESNHEYLLQARKMAALGTFTAGIAHELNNPINNISLTSEALLEDHAEELGADARDLIGDIVGQAERAADIVKNLLDFSRTERPDFTPLEVAEIIGGTLKLLKNQIKMAGVATRVDIPPDLPPIMGHLGNLQQVFMNLLLNGLQAMPDGGELAISAKVDPAGQVWVEVRDTGHGIAPEDLEHIFEPFYSTKEVGKGTGLGLAVTYSLVKRHGGRIEVRGEPGEGTAFSIILPAITTNGNPNHDLAPSHR